MPLISYDANMHESLKGDISTMIQNYSPKEIKWALDLNFATDNPTHSWVDKDLKGNTSNLTADVSAVATSLPIADGVKKYIVNNKTHVIVNDEVMLVTAGAGTNTLTVTRGQMGTAAAIQSANDQCVFKLFEDEGFVADRDDSQAGTRTENYSEIFSRQISISGTSENANSVDGEGGPTYQAKEKMKEIQREIAHSFYNNVARFKDGTGKKRASGGLPFFVTNKYNMGNTALTTSIIDDAIITVTRNGANPDDLVVLASTDQIKQINDFKVGRIQGGGMQDTSTTIRNNVDYYEFSDAVAQVVRVNSLPPGTIYIGEKSKAKIHPFKGRALKVEKLGKKGDSTEQLLVGEYIFVIRNGAQAWLGLRQLARG